MLIGTMNNPANDLLAEIEWMATMGFDFIDLTLEPPLASLVNLDLNSVRSALQAKNLRVVGHTAYYLPLSSPFESLRRAAVDELKRCVEAFAMLGAKWMNLHPDRQAPLHDRKFVIERNLQTIRELQEVERKSEVGIVNEKL